jgi:hypothetical protein
MDLGRIVAGGWTYQMTETDLLMLAKACHWEGGTRPAATLWAYASRLYARRARRETLADLVQAHSQPLNPRWHRTGEFCRPGGAYEHGHECSPRSLTRRDEAQSQTWHQIPSKARALAERFAAARVENPAPGAVDFAAEGLDGDTTTGFLRKNPGSKLVLRAGNLYLATATSRRWPRDLVTVQSGGRVAAAEPRSPAGGLLVLAVVVLVAAAGARLMT